MNNIKIKMQEDILEGKPVMCFDIIDVHCHLGFWHNFNIPWHTAEDMLRAMDKAGINKCIVAAHAGISTDYIQGNSQTIKAMKKFPERILGYCCINPNYPDNEMHDELKRCFDAGMIAIKIHPSMHKTPVNTNGYKTAWEYANKHRLCVLSHTWTGDANCRPSLFAEIALNYPNAKIILGHSGAGYQGGKESIELAKQHNNVYLDIASSTPFNGLLEQLVNGAGAKRVLFGTDLPFMDCRPQVGRIAFSQLDHKQIELILSGNARQLFNL